ncbi:putative ribonuclease H-like domain-containing protein [Tanacetum coccineum]
MGMIAIIFVGLRELMSYFGGWKFWSYIAGGTKGSSKSGSSYSRKNQTTNDTIIYKNCNGAQAGLGGYDWSNDFDEPVTFALMAISSSRHYRVLLTIEIEKKRADNQYKGLLNQLLNSQMTLRLVRMSVLTVRSSDEELTPANMIGLDEYAIRKKIIESKTTELNTDTSKSKTSETLAFAHKITAEFDQASLRFFNAKSSPEPKLQQLHGTGLDYILVRKNRKERQYILLVTTRARSRIMVLKFMPVVAKGWIFLVEDVVQAAQEKTSEDFPKDNDVHDSEDEYILLPLHPHRTRIPVEDVAPVVHEKQSESSPKDNDVQDSKDVADKEGQHQMTEDEQVLHDELEKMITQEVVAKARDEAIPIDASTLPNADLPIDPNMPNLEDDSDAFSNDGIFNGAYDNENVGAVADFNNMDDTINVSPIPTLRIYKDNPKDQILGDPKSAVQTRGKIQKASSAQQALVSHISKQNRTNHKDHQNCLLACFLSQEEPNNITQTLQDESWVEAMQEELLQFKLQKVWILVDLLFGKKAIGTKWEEGIDYDEVFAPVARIEAIRLFLAFASYIGFTVYQMDVKSAFLYGIIEEEVYVHQPPGFVDPAHPNKVYKVIKALYGLHQAPRAWYETLSSFLMENGFRRGTIDKTLFIKKKKSDIMLVQVYVDDIIFGSTKKSMCTEFEDCMHKRFQMSSMGELTFFLGLQVKQQPDGIFISQDKYVADILKKFDFWSIRTATTPIESNKPLVKDEDGVDVDVHVYRSMIGSLMYLTASRPDIMFAVCACARFQVTPKASHLNAVKRIFRRLISWQCKKQTIVANYTTGVEYVAVASCCGQVLWIQDQMMDYGFNFMNTKIHIDNESTISVIKNPVAHSRTKHIEIQFHFIRDCYEKRLIEVIKIHTDHNVVDLLTKGFDVTRFNFLVVSIGLLNM